MYGRRDYSSGCWLVESDGTAVATAVWDGSVVVGGGRQSGRRRDRWRRQRVAWTSRRLGKVRYRSHRRRVLLLWQHRCRPGRGPLLATVDGASVWSLQRANLECKAHAGSPICSTCRSASRAAPVQMPSTGCHHIVDPPPAHAVVLTFGSPCTTSRSMVEAMGNAICCMPTLLCIHMPYHHCRIMPLTLHALASPVSSPQTPAPCWASRC